MVANAIDAQVANAIEAFATLFDMPDATALHRRTRLQALVDHEDFGGNKSALGRALGYANGAHVRQMIAGERAITEKTVQKLETMSAGRYRGWFKVAEKASPTGSSQGGSLMSKEWPFKAVPSSIIDGLSPAEMGIVEGAMLDALLRIQAVRKMTDEAKPGTHLGNARRA